MNVDQASSSSNPNQWFQADITFGASESGYIMIEGIIGNGYYGDIAIDDITIRTCVSNI